MRPMIGGLGWQVLTSLHDRGDHLCRKGCLCHVQCGYQCTLQFLGAA